MKQCPYCSNVLLFLPLSGEYFLCCSAFGETVDDINIDTGVSFKVAEYGSKPPGDCPKFQSGKSVCLKTVKTDDPFGISPVRVDGEKKILAKLRKL